MEWIKITDRHPDTGMDILVYTDNKECLVAYYDVSWTDPYFEVCTEGFRDTYADNWLHWDKVTHWMPLPEAPNDKT